MGIPLFEIPWIIQTFNFFPSSVLQQEPVEYKFFKNL